MVSERKTDVCMDGWIDGWMVGLMYGRMVGLIGAWATNRRKPCLLCRKPLLLL